MIDCNYDYNQITNCITRILENKFTIDSNLIYGDGNAAKKMVKAMNDFEYSFTKTFISSHEK